ncbi:ABC transporter ATP-binding protein [Methermicoccus shengliensis]|nr:ABC transporter ATP-binding protein [Methermicoccus shengliensis]KUK30306.1 MAG: ABC transporter, ATP binding protein [Methanosarcinales archeaon 56_1174]
MRLKVRGITFGYTSTPTLDDIAMEVDTSEILSIVGPNGAGKTTLLRCIDRIVSPQRGCILLDGRDVRKMDRREVARQLAYVPQTAPHAFPHTVFDSVLLGRRPHVQWHTTDEDIEKVIEVIQRLNIEHLALREFNELSGGERQKVMIARALVQEPEVLLLDEPNSNLDIRHQLELMEIIRKLANEEGMAVVVAIHDLNLAARYSDRIVIMKGGRIVGAGSPREVLTEEKIREVYGVEARVLDVDGNPHVIVCGVA